MPKLLTLTRPFGHAADTQTEEVRLVSRSDSVFKATRIIYIVRFASSSSQVRNDFLERIKKCVHSRFRIIKMVVNFDKNYPRQSFVPTSSASVALTLIMAAALGASSIDQDTTAIQDTTSNVIKLYGGV